MSEQRKKKPKTQGSASKSKTKSRPKRVARGAAKTGAAPAAGSSKDVENPVVGSEPEEKVEDPGARKADVEQSAGDAGVSGGRDDLAGGGQDADRRKPAAPADRSTADAGDAEDEDGSDDIQPAPVSPFGFPGPMSPIAIAWTELSPSGATAGPASEETSGRDGFDKPEPVSDALGFQIEISYLTYFKPSSMPPPKSCDRVEVDGRTLCRRTQEVVQPETMAVLGLSTLQQQLDGDPKLQGAFVRSAEQGTEPPLLPLLEVENASFPFSLSAESGRLLFEGQLALDIRSQISAAKDEAQPGTEDGDTDRGADGAAGGDPAGESDESTGATRYQVVVRVGLVVSELAAPGQPTIRHQLLDTVQGSTTVAIPASAAPPDEPHEDLTGE